MDPENQNNSANEIENEENEYEAVGSINDPADSEAAESEAFAGGGEEDDLNETVEIGQSKQQYFEENPDKPAEIDQSNQQNSEEQPEEIGQSNQQIFEEKPEGMEPVDNREPSSRAMASTYYDPDDLADMESVSKIKARDLVYKYDDENEQYTEEEQRQIVENELSRIVEEDEYRNPLMKNAPEDENEDEPEDEKDLAEDQKVSEAPEEQQKVEEAPAEQKEEEAPEEQKEEEAPEEEQLNPDELGGENGKSVTEELLDIAKEDDKRFKAIFTDNEDREEEKQEEAPAEEKKEEAPAEEKKEEAPAEEKKEEAPAEEKDDSYVLQDDDLLEKEIGDLMGNEFEDMFGEIEQVVPPLEVPEDIDKLLDQEVARHDSLADVGYHSKYYEIEMNPPKPSMVKELAKAFGSGLLGVLRGIPIIGAIVGFFADVVNNAIESYDNMQKQLDEQKPFIGGNDVYRLAMWNTVMKLEKNPENAEVFADPRFQQALRTVAENDPDLNYAASRNHNPDFYREHIMNEKGFDKLSANYMQKMEKIATNWKEITATASKMDKLKKLELQKNKNLNAQQVKQPSINNPNLNGPSK